MPKYSLTKNGNVVQCKWNCHCNHKHYVGTYENALNFFDVDLKEVHNYGDLINIVIYHQTSQYTIPKLTYELYNILIDSMSEHKYWVEPSMRHDEAIKTLQKANNIGLIEDNKIYNTIKNKESNNPKQNRRIYMNDLWLDKYGPL